MNSRLRLSTCVALCLLAAGPLHARGVSPYLPLNLAPELERDVEQVGSEDRQRGGHGALSSGPR